MKINGFLIDPANREIYPITLCGDDFLTHAYRTIGCRVIDYAPFSLSTKTTYLIIDDEGLLCEEQSFFMVDNNRLIAGSALVFDVNGQGETVSCSLTIVQVRESVRFFNLSSPL